MFGGNWDKKERLVIGLMSGTSCDGIDAALVRISGSGTDSAIKLEAFQELNFSSSVQKLIKECQGPEAGSNRKLTLLDSYLGELFAHAALALCKKAGIEPSEVDVIGSHGQTLYHHPRIEKFPGFSVNGTFQVGNPALIAERTGITVVSDFRSRDMAVGGQGAPLAAYLDYVLYHNVSRSRLVLNIGGLANVTVLPSKGDMDGVWAFDTGPGNCLIDLAVSRVSGGKKSYDRDGVMAMSGKTSHVMVRMLMEHPFLALKPPKSADKDTFGAAFLDKITQALPPLNGADLISTLTEFTVKSIAVSIMEFALQRERCEEIIISGGGAHNPVIIEGLKAALPKLMLSPADAYSIPAKAKEAVLMAVLAHESACGSPGNVPSATGARKRVVLGSITPGINFFSGEESDNDASPDNSADA